MEAVRRTVELGRAARAQAKVKLRQPLRKAVVVASDAERDAIERLAEVVASELNVKELDFVADEAELVSYRAKPNYRSLGPRFGKNMPQVAAAVEALDAAAVADALERGEEVGIQVEGKDHTLTADDISLVMEPLEGYQVEAESGHAVALELDLDDELRREGLAREVVRAVQEARKQAGLEVSDRIALALGGDEELLGGRPRARGLHRGRDPGDLGRLRRRRRRREGDDRGPRAAHRGQQGLSGAVDAVIFDLDGLLVDSEAVWDDVRKRFVEEQGGHWHDGAQRDMMGMSSVEWSRYVRDRLGVDMEPEEISRAVADASPTSTARTCRCCPARWRPSNRSPGNGRSASPPHRTAM